MGIVGVVNFVCIIVGVADLECVILGVVDLVCVIVGVACILGADSVRVTYYISYIVHIINRLYI